jgi:hypothetical protein
MKRAPERNREIRNFGWETYGRVKARIKSENPFI